MTLQLSPQIEALINRKVAEGRYETPTEVVESALHLLEEHDQQGEFHLEELQRQVAVGLEQLDRGEMVPGDQVFCELRELSRERRALP